MTRTASERGIVLIPGAWGGPYQPLLSYTWLAGRDRGAEVHHVEWPAERPSLADSPPWVVAQIMAVLDAFPVDRPVLAGKSLGSYAAPLAVERGLPAVWLTPLLTHAPFVEPLRRATAPYLLIGGTADEWWDGDLARELTPHILEIPGADHGMILRGEPLARSAEVLGQVATAIEAFLDTHVWPA